VRGFLDAFEIPGERIPLSLDAQAALYRSLLADRRMLVVLDNARDSAQVLPLLPGSEGCVVLVTSRTRLTGLITDKDARPLTVDLLPVAEARQLLARRLGARRVAAEPQAVEQIIAMCAQLPLALSIAAARAASHPAFSLAAVAAELREARGSLQAFTDADFGTDLRTVFSWSYQQLAIPAARLFRLLALHPGPAIGTPAAASLAAVPLVQARDLLAELARTHLIEEPSPGRFTFHDLMRAYATELAQAHEPDVERRDALHRVLDHYLHTAHAAARFLHPRMDLAITIPLSTGVISREFADPEAAWGWFETEYPVFMDVIRLAAEEERYDYAWQLPTVLEEYLDRRGYRHDCRAAQRTALAAARNMKDRHGQACAHYGLGRVFHWYDDFGEARKHLEQALALFEGPSENTLKAHAHVELSHVFEHRARLDKAVRQACLDEALRHARLALTLARSAGNQRAEARALHFAGKYHVLLGDYQQGLSFSQQALALNREVGDRRSEVYTLNGIGYAYHCLGQYDQAVAYYQEELALKSELADRYSQAVTLTNLGDTYHEADNDEAARSAWQQALDILEDFGNVDDADADAGHVRPEQLRARLRGLGNVEPRVHL
jgi:tetratricopeptide (TPR) repeat protein